MSDLNEVTLIGRLGADPETRYSQGGTPVTNIRLATGEKWKDKQTGETKERTEWHSIVLFGRTAEVAGEYLRKGSRVWIRGQNRTEKWEDKEGVERYTTKVYADRLILLDGRKEGGTDRQQEDRQRKPAGGRGQPARQAPPPDDFDDDIPF